MGKAREVLEARVLHDVLALSGKLPGVRLFRNTVGAVRAQSGRFLRYGLGVGTPDIIGWRRVLVTPDMVGKSMAVFVGVEVKAPGEEPTEEQLRFLRDLHEAGGIAGWADSLDAALPLVSGQPLSVPVVAGTEGVATHVDAGAPSHR